MENNFDPVDLLKRAVEAHRDGWPLPDDVEEWVSDAFKEHLNTGRSMDEILGLSGGKGRRARTKVLEKMRNNNLKIAFGMLGTHYERSERVDIFMEDIVEFMLTKAENWLDNGVDEDADEYELAIARAVFACKGSLPKSRKQFQRILDMG